MNPTRGAATNRRDTVQHNGTVTDHSAMGFVRDATAADAAVIASIQSACWHAAYGQTWPAEVFDSLSAQDLEMQWARAVIAPPGPGYRLLVATEGDQVVGFAALAPSEDPDAQVGEAEIVAWEVRPEHRRSGHGGRLLNAAADHARSIGAHTLTIWLAPEDEARRSLLASAGFGPDGAHREVALTDGWADSPVTMRQVRLLAGL